MDSSIRSYSMSPMQFVRHVLLLNLITNLQSHSLLSKNAITRTSFQTTITTEKAPKKVETYYPVQLWTQRFVIQLSSTSTIVVMQESKTSRPTHYHVLWDENNFTAEC